MSSATPLKANATNGVPQKFQSGDTVPPGNGGTGLSSFSSGSLLYASGSNVWAALAIGSAGQVLQVVGSTPTWVTLSATVGLNIIDAYTNENASPITIGEAVYFSANGGVNLADNSTSWATSICVGLVYDSSISASASGNIILAGVLPGATSGQTFGTELFLSTAGALTTTPPSSSGTTVVRVAICINATDVVVHPVARYMN